MVCPIKQGSAPAVAPVGAWYRHHGDNQPARALARSRRHLLAVWLRRPVCFARHRYALQDTEFDRANGLRSLPAWLGNKRALLFSRLAHVLMIGLLAMVGVSAGLGIIYTLAITLVAVLIAWEQSLVKPDDLSRLNLAFFTLNSYISAGLFLLTLADVLVRR